MIALLPAALAAAVYLIWQSNRTAYDRHLIEQAKGYTNTIRDINVDILSEFRRPRVTIQS